MKEKFKKYWLHILAIVALLLLTYTCVNNKQHELEGERKQLKEQLKSAKSALVQQENNRKVLKDSFSREIKKAEEKVSKLEQNNLELRNKVVSLQNKAKGEKEKVKNYSNKQFAEYFNIRYNTNTTDFDSTSVKLKSDTPKKIVEELIDKDEFEDTVKIQDTIINNMEKVVEEKDKVIEFKDKEIVEAEKSIKLSAETLKVAEELNKSAEKQIKTLKVKGTVVKILVPLAFLAGFLISN